MGDACLERPRVYPVKQGVGSISHIVKIKGIYQNLTLEFSKKKGKK
jgi:hypothetical protein